MKKLLFLFLTALCAFNINAQSCDSTLPISETFDNPSIVDVCWNTIDQDGDGNNWYWWEYSSVYGGHKVISSNSFYTSTGALTPDNWIVSNAIDLRSLPSGSDVELSWKVRGELAGFAHEYYTVYAATGNTVSALQSSPVKRGEYVDEVGGNGVFTTRKLNLSSLAGNIVYIAFRHHNSSNQYNINIDDVAVYEGGTSNECDLDSDNDGVCDENDRCPGQDDALIGTACNDNNPCTVNDVYDENCGCSGTYLDSDNDGVCDANDECDGFDDNIDTNGNGIPDGCDDTADCSQTNTSFSSSQLTHTGSGAKSTTLTLPTASKDVSFSISGIGQKTKGKSSSKYIERVRVTYKDGSGAAKTQGTYRGDQVSSANISISGTVQSVTVSLDDAFDGNTGSQMNVGLGSVTYCGISTPCPDGDNDGVCDADDLCPNTPAGATVDNTGCEVSGCQQTSSNFSGDSLSGSNSTTMSLGGIGEDVSFTISGINTKLKGKRTTQYIEIVEVMYDNGSGAYQTYATYSGASRSSASIAIAGPVTSIRVVLSNDLGNTSANMNINFSAVSYCLSSAAAKASVSKNPDTKEDDLLESAENTFKVYPNPVSSSLFIRTPKVDSPSLNVSLFNLQGVRVNHTNLDSRYSQKFEIDATKLSAGLYILQISNEKNTLLKTERIIVE